MEFGNRRFYCRFYCHESRLAVEIDGRVHEKQKDYDELRQELISSKGIRFVRISNDEINRDVNLLLEMIGKLAE